MSIYEVVLLLCLQGNYFILLLCPLNDGIYFHCHICNYMLIKIKAT